MAERALTAQAVKDGLQDIRLPPDAPGGMAAELLVAVALGLLLAVLLGQALRLVTVVRPAARPPRLGQRIAALAPLPDEDRRLALLHLLKETDPAALARLSAALYRPGGLPPAAEIEAELSRHA